jgi:hypothetical protein
VHEKGGKRPKTLALLKGEKAMSYKSKDRQTGNLFSELLPFGGKLSMENRWIKLHDLIPWKELEGIYGKYFSHLGRRGKDSQLINGLLIVKHKMGMSDEELVQQFLENPYIQYFCGYDQFVKEGEIESSTVSKVRKRLGVEYFKKFEDEILSVLKDRKIIKTDEQMVDATVFPTNITYPTDTGVIEKAREWVVKAIKTIIKITGVKEKVRTYCRKAKATYLEIAKKRKRKQKEIYRVNKKMAQYLRRNIGQLTRVLERVDILTDIPIEKIKKQLEIAEEIYRQQMEMLKAKTHSVKARIVSFHSPHIRPIVRGKSGKDVEFGPKAVLSYVDGYAFLDKFSFDAFNESTVLEEDIKEHEKRFGRLPDCVITDNIYGTRENRRMLYDKKVRASLIPLGRRQKEQIADIKWIKKKQRKRNRIEGIIGTGKNKYGLERILYKIPGGEEIWVRLGLSAMNLSTALARI